MNAHNYFIKYFFFALGRRKIVPNILVDFALACLWGRGFGGINLGVCVVSCNFGKDLVEGNLMGEAWRGDTHIKNGDALSPLFPALSSHFFKKDL